VADRKTVKGNVDYRLLERFRAKQKLNVQQQPGQRRYAAAVASHRLPALDLRD
jgi:hypothetical protein